MLIDKNYKPETISEIYKVVYDIGYFSSLDKAVIFTRERIQLDKSKGVVIDPSFDINENQGLLSTSYIITLTMTITRLKSDNIFNFPLLFKHSDYIRYSTSELQKRD